MSHHKALLILSLSLCCLLRPALTFAAQFPGEVYFLDFESTPSVKLGSATVSMEIDHQTVHSGKGSLRMTAPPENWEKNYGVYDLGGLPLSPDTEYVLTYWIKGEKVTSHSGHMTIVNKTAQQLPNGGMNWTDSAYNFGGYPLGTYDWRQVESRFKTNKTHDTTWGSLLFQDGGGTVWLDDVRLMTAEAFANQKRVSVVLETEMDRLRFIPGEKVLLYLRVRNNQPSPLSLDVTGSIKDGNRLLVQGKKHDELQGSETKRIAVLKWDTAHLRTADYPVRVQLTLPGEEPILLSSSLRLCPPVKPDQTDFFWSIWAQPYPDEARTRPLYEHLQQYHLAPTFGSLPSTGMDLVLEYGLPFSARLGIDVPFANRKTVKNEVWNHPVGSFGLSDPASWEVAGKQMEANARLASQYPAFSNYFTTSDDFSAATGWDWADGNLKRFKELYGIETPRPEVFLKNAPPYDAAYAEMSKRPKGIIPEDDPWLLWTKFLAKDVLGQYNDALRKGVERGSTGARIGQVSGGMQWPLYQLNAGMYPPMNFGKSGFNLSSFYYYLNYWQPEIVHIYWCEVARMGCRENPVWCLADSMLAQQHYMRNNFYLLLAGGVQGISYFTYEITSKEFWEEAKPLAKVIHENRQLLTCLRPADRSVGYLVSFTTSAFNLASPVYTVFAYANLLNAHVSVEPICEEEVCSDWLDRYQTIILSDIGWLTPKVIQRLEDFVRRGRTVLVDSATKVPIQGARRLDLALNGTGWLDTYGRKTEIEKVCKALADLPRSWADSDDPYLVIRPFEAEGARYCWVVNVETDEEYHTLRRSVLGWPGEKNLTREEYIAYEKQKNFNQGVYESNVNFSATNAVVYDVLTGRLLTGSTADDHHQFKVVMPRLGGTLLMTLPKPIARLKVSGPSSIKRGARGFVSIHLEDQQGKPIPGAVPVAIKVTGHEGVDVTELRHVVTRKGLYYLSLDVPINIAPGKWQVEVSTRFLSEPPKVLAIRIE